MLATAAFRQTGATQKFDEINAQRINIVDANGTLAIKNTGTVEHNFAITGTNKRTAMLKPGSGATLSLGGLKPGTYSVICEVPGHSGSGMKATLMVGGGGGAAGNWHPVSGEELLALIFE